MTPSAARARGAALVGSCVVGATLLGLPACGGKKKSRDTVVTPDPTTSTGKGTDAGASWLPLILRKNDPVPERLGGAVAPMPPRTATPGTSSPHAPGPIAPSPIAPGPPRAVAPSQAEPAAQAQASAASAAPVELAIRHDHPPGEACKPLTAGEIEKAFADLGAK